MSYFKLIPVVEVTGTDTVKVCEDYSNNWADEILVFERSTDDISHEKNIDILKQVSQNIDIPFMVAGNIKRLEDVKKYIYAGADKAILNIDDEGQRLLIKEASERFGKNRIGILISESTKTELISELNQEYFELVIFDKCYNEKKALFTNKIKLPLNCFESDEEMIAGAKENVYGAAMKISQMTSISMMVLKNKLKEKGVETFTLTSSVDFKELTPMKFKDKDIITVVVQDYRTDEVLMVAYMDEDAFNSTIETGRMTYYSRSRDEQWIKGLTSGHFQYLKELCVDCDKDTLLAKVFQVGAACHTGNTTCFFETISKKEYKENNPAKLLNGVYDVILDRKNNPKEGSYTNYLFDKGIDKILKKLGEEATEIVIAAKNPNPEEIKYEISDFLYHMLVLMVEKDVTWQEVLDELGRRG